MNVITSDITTGVLASPFTINKLLIKNRIVLGPMAVLRPTANGRPSEQTIAFLTRRAKGGVGLVIVGGSVASERAWNESPFFPNLRFDKDEFIPDLARLVDAVHEAGSPIFARFSRASAVWACLATARRFRRRAQSRSTSAPADCLTTSMCLVAASRLFRWRRRRRRSRTSRAPS